MDTFYNGNPFWLNSQLFQRVVINNGNGYLDVDGGLLLKKKNSFPFLTYFDL